MNRLEIMRMNDFIRELDIAKNPEPAAIFDPLIQGFNVWAIPTDHPGGDWERVVEFMDAGAYTKRSAYVGCAFYYAGDKNYMVVTSDAYLLADHIEGYAETGMSKRYAERFQKKPIHNRPEDIAWVIEKVKWVFE